MQKLKQKQLEQLKEKQEQIRHEYKHVLDSLLHEEQIRILIQYCKQQLKNTDSSKIQNINDFSPVSISRLIFMKQLKLLKAQFQKLPNHQCPLQHFLLIMLKIVKFPFQKSPYYLLGLKQMFKQIKGNQKLEVITYQQLENYVLGQVVNFNDQNQHDTEFQIQFAQNKMQDFLMHDNGVKKIHFSHDLKKYIVLDQGSNIIKIYDQRMKIVAKFQPNKQKHNKKHPLILTFDYNQLGSKLGISLADNTFSIINLGNFLTATSQEAFRSVFLNQVCYKSSGPIIKIHFLSMMNKWLCIDQSNQIWVYDVQKYKEQNENYCKKLKHPNDDFQIKQVLQIVSLAAVCFLINNQIWFFNQTLSKKKYKKFSHCQEIKQFVYVEERNMFVLVGKDEKYLTMFNLNKATGDINKIWNFQTNQIIADFAVFPFLNTILILDVQNNLKVYNQTQPIVQYQQNYQTIVKKKDLKIKMLKYSKSQFLIHATYILVMELKKVAIQRDMQFNFLDTFYYDTSKEQITFSVNGQILGLALMHGQVRKNIATQNSNLQKHKAVYMGKNTELFAIDDKESLYQIYSKNDLRYKQNKDHRKSVGIVGGKKSFYDEETRMIIMISQSSVYIVRNDGQNNFTFKSCLLFQNSPHFIKYKYYPQKKWILFLDSNNTLYLMNSLNYEILRIIKIDVFKQVSQAQKIVIDIEYQQKFDVLMILTNNGQFGIVNINDTQKCVYIRMRDILPYKLESLAFTSFGYQRQHRQKNQVFSSRVYFFNQIGWLIQLELDTILSKVIGQRQFQEKHSLHSYIKDTHQVDFKKLVLSKKIQQVKILKQKLYKPQVPAQANFIKVHDRQIVFSKRIMLEGYYLLTIGEDGHIKLWGQKRKLYFDFKLPLVVKIQWNMNQLHERRNKRIVNQTNQFLLKVSNRIKQIKDRQILNIHNHKKKLRNKSEKIKINLQNPIPLQFQNKDIEQIVMNNKQINVHNMTIDVVGRQKNAFSMNQTKRLMSITQRVGEPWRKKRQFMDIYEKASPVDKYVHKFKEKMPLDLLLMRNDLHIGENIPNTKKQSKTKQQKLRILPQLTTYLKNVQLQKSTQLQNNPEDVNNEKDVKIFKREQQNKFQSCLFVKTERGPKKANAFDQIDKYFNKKQQQLLNKKWIPNKRNLMKKNESEQPQNDTSLMSNNYKSSQYGGKVDAYKSVIKIFEQHNRQAILIKNARLIKIPYPKSQMKHTQKKKL